MYILYIIVLKIKLITNLHALSVAIHVPPNNTGETGTLVPVCREQLAIIWMRCRVNARQAPARQIGRCFHTPCLTGHPSICHPQLAIPIKLCRCILSQIIGL